MTLLKGARRVVPRGVRLQASALLARRQSARLSADLARIAAGRSIVIAGPWLGEVGFELLYWVPFLRWCAEHFRIPSERLLVVSRGGSSAWYAPFASRYADVFDCISAETYREQHDARVAAVGQQKQSETTEFERRLVKDIAAAHGLETWTLLHPSRMYELFKFYWWGHQPHSWIEQHAVYARLVAPSCAEASLAPGSYTAVKFYFNECFPQTSRNEAFAREVVRVLRNSGPVVSLSTGLQIDDHAALVGEEGGVIPMPRVPPARNLHVQSAIVAGAKTFVGTYGGFSYLAPFHGVPALTLVSNAAGYSQKHLDMARAAFELTGAPASLRVCQTETIDNVLEMLPPGTFPQLESTS